MAADEENACARGLFELRLAGTRPEEEPLWHENISSSPPKRPAPCAALFTKKAAELARVCRKSGATWPRAIRRQAVSRSRAQLARRRTSGPQRSGTRTAHSPERFEQTRYDLEAASAPAARRKKWTIELPPRGVRCHPPRGGGRQHRQVRTGGKVEKWCDGPPTTAFRHAGIGRLPGRQGAAQRARPAKASPRRFSKRSQQGRDPRRQTDAGAAAASEATSQGEDRLHTQTRSGHGEFQ